MTLSADVEEFNEDVSGSQDVIVTAKLSRLSASATDVKVTMAKNTGRYAVTVGGVDTNELTITVPIGVESMTGTFTVTPEDDNEYKGDVTISITGEATGSFVNNTSVKMLDEDSDFTLTTAPTQVNESDGTTSVTVTATHQPEGNVSEATTIRLSFEAPSGITIGGTHSITIANATDDASAVITVTVPEDETHTGERTVKVKGTTGDKVVFPAKIAIVDAESAPTVTKLDASPKTLAEDGGAQNVSVTATLSSVSTKDTDVAITVVADDDGETVVAWEKSGASKIVVPAGKKEMSATITITPTDNDVYDGDATIIVFQDLDDSGVHNDNEPMVELTLEDEDFDFNLTANPGSISEDGGTQSVVITASMPEGKTAESATTMTLAVAAGGPTVTLAGTNSITVGTGANNASATITLTPTNDEIYTGPRDITITGEAAGNDISPAKVSQTDDESAPEVTLSIVDEADKVVE